MTSDEKPIENIEPLCTLQVNGWNACKTEYAKLASKNAWPPVEDLLNSV